MCPNRIRVSFQESVNPIERSSKYFVAGASRTELECDECDDTDFMNWEARALKVVQGLFLNHDLPRFLRGATGRR